MTTHTTSGSIDEHLGPASGRYFGEGFKRVDHALTELSLGQLDGRGCVAATATLSYPGDWSRKSAGSLRPHLSSIDGLVIAVELADAYLTHSFGLDLARRRRAWVRSFEMRVAAPTEELESFPVSARHEGCTPVLGGYCDFVSTFACLVGTIRVTCEIEHEIATCDARAGRYATADELLGDALLRHYGDAYKRRTQDIAEVATSADDETVRAAIGVRDPLATVDLGLGGAYQPAVSMVDCLLSMAQLAQVLAYSLDSVQRAESNTFWMRRLSFSADTPVHALGERFDAGLGVPRSKLLEVGGSRWRALDLGGHFGAISTNGSIAHALPAARTARSRLAAASALPASSTAPGLRAVA
jgi:hypothetical protein